MVFSSLPFLCVFFPAVFLLHWLIPIRWVRNGLLIIASLAFYAYGEPVYVLLMLGSTVANWLLALAIGKAVRKKPTHGVGGVGFANKVRNSHGAQSSLGARNSHGAQKPRAAKGAHGVVKAPSAGEKAAKVLVALAVVINLGFLGLFKYAGFAASTLGFQSPDLALPIGISFYTFQALSYVIDVYRRDVKAQPNYFNVLLYISFFPQLVAGPIIKYHDVQDQLRKRVVTFSDVTSGLRRFCFGLGKKVLIANTMAACVDSVFGAELSSINITVAWIGAVAYLLQIYFDFSGYSDMAIGMARMFGFHYPENFKYPYGATSIQSFWHRWHISLSTWFKEYLYIPLGGNRCGKGRTVFNKLAVFFLCGLWHGASWTFVVWGLIHGFFLLLEEYLPIRKLPKALGWIYCLLVVTVAFVIFRADTLSQGAYIISQMFTGFHGSFASSQLALQQLTPAFVLCAILGIVGALPVKGILEAHVQGVSADNRAIWEGLSYLLAFGLLALSLLSLASGGYNPFIYFRF